MSSDTIYGFLNRPLNLLCYPVLTCLTYSNIKLNVETPKESTKILEVVVKFNEVAKRKISGETISCVSLH